VPIRPQFPTGAPRFLTLGLLRLAVLCAVIVAIGMVGGRLTPTTAGWVALVGLVVLPLALALPYAAAVRRLAGRVAVGEAALRSVRAFGLVGLGAAFFLFWTFVYLSLWWANPEEAFRGLSEAPRFADFFYYAVSTAFISPPGDFFANSRGARSATMIEMLTGFALLAAYLSSFVDWRRSE
jgi:hypothetical protein